MWHIFFIMWISWSWKWTLINNIKKTWIDFHIPLSYKTRNIRDTEINWKDAFFISKWEFFEWIEKWEFLEYAIVHETDYYGTKYNDVIENWIQKWKVVIKELDIHGLKRLKKERPEFDNNYTTIFLDIPSNVLPTRIMSRWDLITNEELYRRINSAIIEEEEAKTLCDFSIDATNSPDEVLKNFLKIVNNKIWKYT